jgi:co-chaperonin GroES (HSP10)
MQYTNKYKKIMRGQVTFNGIIIRISIEKPVEQKTKSGIILPSGIEDDVIKKMQLFKEHPYKGEVLQVGSNVTVCKVGDMVLLANEALSPLIEDSVYYHYIREHEVIYVISKEEVKKKKMEDMATQHIGASTLILN